MNEIEYLEEISVDLLKWFEHNGMKANSDKSNLLLSSNILQTFQ